MYPNPLVNCPTQFATVNISDLSYLYFTQLGYTESLHKGG
jgi:hypothetical protein